METKNCQNCHLDFVIDERDQNYYQKIDVPHPTWCPKCRFERRMSTHNVWSVYWRNCAKCEKRTLSMYNKTVPIEVYCNDCWWSDEWDGTEYGMEYDPTRNFFEQVYELSRKTPWVAQEVLAPTMVNSEFCNGASYLRNCYLTFWADYSENVSNASVILELKDSTDCLRARESQLCSESIGINKCYRTFYSEECDACTDVWFSRNCYNCTNCIGCVNVRDASYMIFNVQYSKDEYLQKLAEFGFDTYSGIEAMKSSINEFWDTLPYREYTGNSMNLNVTGEYIFESKNSEDMYLCTSAEDSRYCQFVTVPSAKECYDYSGWGAGAERIYESHSTGENVANVKFSYCSYTDCLDVEYSWWVISGKQNFGCVNLKRKKYCILNKEYSKEEYEKLRGEIIADMKKNPYVDEQGRTWTYGESFPLMMNHFGYNECSGSKYAPKTKEQALAEGYRWYDDEPALHSVTLLAKDLPQTVTTTDESVLREIIGCAECGRGYKIGQLELSLLQKMQLPLPHTCPSCRQNARFERLNPPELWDRNCAKCSGPIKTAFSPEGRETVYCVSCYQQEFV
ncbi:MAG: hypothetical protein WCG55_02585 [bacterium]